MLDLFYSIERRKVRYPRVTVYPDLSVKFVIPLRYSDEHIQHFIKEHQPWVQKKLAAFSKPRPKFIELQPGEILFMGKAVIADFDPRNQKELEKFYRSQAKHHFVIRTTELATQFGFTFNKISITGAQTRWGSCSSKKNLSFTFSLVKAPPSIIDYVILHELAHTKIMNHSPRFWDLVSKLYPDHKIARKWLRVYGRELSQL
ncbi:MAG: SprT family zinc-dependent metalloprotease [bacterium]